MNNDKFITAYIEIMTATLNDYVVNSIQMKANARVTEEAVNEIVKQNEQLKYDLNHATQDSQNTIELLQKQISELNTMKGEFENSKNQLNHLNTFRDELTNARREISELREQNESLNQEINKLKSDNKKVKKVSKDQPKEEVQEPVDYPTVITTADLFKK